MVHIALPHSKIGKGGKTATHTPGYYADTGIPALIQRMRALGCPTPDRSGGFTVKLAGGANVLNTRDTFKIGRRNVMAVREILGSYGLTPAAEDVGGTISRTVTVDVNSGQITISSALHGKWNI